MENKAPGGTTMMPRPVSTFPADSSQSSSWNSPPKAVVVPLLTVLKGDRSWPYIARRLSHLNRCWKAELDSFECRLHFVAFANSTLDRKTKRRILQRKTITALHVSPFEDQPVNAASVMRTVPMTALREVQLEEIDNGDEVLARILQRSAEIYCLKLMNVKLTHGSLKRFKRLKTLRNLHLHGVTKAYLEAPDYRLLGECKHLVILELMYCEGCTDLRFLESLTELESFGFATDSSRVKNMSCISTLASIKTLSLITNTVKSCDLESFSFPEQLIALKIDRRNTEKLWTKRLEKMTALAFQSKMTNKLVSSLKGAKGLSHPILLPWQRNSTRSVVWYRQSAHIKNPDVSPLHVVDLSNMTIATNIIGFLAEYTRLRELRLHFTCMTEVAAEDSLTDETDTPLPFPSLEVLTVNPSAFQIDVLKRMEVPNLTQAGIWFDLGRCDLVVETVNAIMPVREISFAMNGMPESESFWKGLGDVLSNCASLTRVGWKDYQSESQGLPENLSRYLQSSAVLIDTDATVFAL